MSTTGDNNDIGSNFVSGWLIGQGIGYCIIFGVLTIEYCTDNVDWTFNKIKKIIDNKNE
jgi:F0F1-type ATP synthase assembly protein I